MPQPEEQRIFISYSHQDAIWLDHLQTMLAPLTRTRALSLWSDEDIRAGALWRDEIGKALSAAKAAVLLVSPNFLASDFIVNQELPPLLMAAREKGLTILWIAVSDSMYRETAISEYQALNDPANPLDSLTPSALNRELVKIAEQIKEVVNAAEAHADAPTPPPVRGKPMQQERALDAALPKRVQVGKSAELLVMIRRSDSPGLRAVVEVEADSRFAKEDVRCKPFPLEFPVSFSGQAQPVDVVVSVNSPDFDPPSQSRKLRIPPDGDTEVCSFLMTPRSAGELLLNIEVLKDDIHRASKTLRTEAQPSGVPVAPAGYVLVSIPLVAMAQEGEATACLRCGSAVSRLAGFCPVCGAPQHSEPLALPQMAAPAKSLENYAGQIPVQPPVELPRSRSVRSSAMYKIMGGIAAASVLVLVAPLAWQVLHEGSKEGLATVEINSPAVISDTGSGSSTTIAGKVSDPSLNVYVLTRPKGQGGEYAVHQVDATGPGGNFAADVKLPQSEANDMDVVVIATKRPIRAKRIAAPPKAAALARTTLTRKQASPPDEIRRDATVPPARRATRPPL